MRKEEKESKKEVPVKDFLKESAEHAGIHAAGHFVGKSIAGKVGGMLGGVFVGLLHTGTLNSNENDYLNKPKLSEKNLKEMGDKNKLYFTKK